MRSKITPQSNNGKRIYQTSWNQLREGIIIISRTRIRTWRAMLIVFFAAGFASALTLAVSQDWMGRIFGAEKQITNIAQVVYEDADGGKYGPVNSNTIITTKAEPSPQACSDETAYGQCSEDQPKYCQEGVLINNCSQCGCQAGEICIADGSCKVLEPIKVRVELEGKTTFTSTLNLYVLTLGTDNIVFQDQSTSGNDGKAEIETAADTLPANVYDFKVTVPYYLSKKISNITWPSEVEIKFDDVPAGNLQDDDDEINALDWSIMSQNWGEKYLNNNRPEVDINQDGIVNAVDWSFMQQNWGKKGD